MLIIGLTGDVGAGKSTLCRLWRKMGAEVFDADTLAREMWKKEEVQSKAKERWGKDFFSGEWKMVLAKIADKIFPSKEEYNFAASLLHSAAIAELKELVCKSKSPWVVVEIPLLYECGVPEWFDGVVYVSAPLEKRIERNSVRNWNKEEILRRESHLLPRDEKIRRANWVLENTGTADVWEAKGAELGKFFLQKSKAKA